MEGILALLIPVLALATGFVAVLRMPPEALAGKKRQSAPLPAAADQALLEEVTVLRDELAQVRERVDFMERLMLEAPAAPGRIAAPAQAPLARPADA